MTICLLSLGGMPPTGGFFGKFYVFKAAMEVYDGQLLWLVVVGVINSAISIYYYLRIVTAMYFREANQPFTPTRSPGLLFVIALCPIVDPRDRPDAGLVAASSSADRWPAACVRASSATSRARRGSIPTYTSWRGEPTAASDEARARGARGARRRDLGIDPDDARAGRSRRSSASAGARSCRRS